MWREEGDEGGGLPEELLVKSRRAIARMSGVKSDEEWREEKGGAIRFSLCPGKTADRILPVRSLSKHCRRHSTAWRPVTRL